MVLPNSKVIFIIYKHGYIKYTRLIYVYILYRIYTHTHTQTHVKLPLIQHNKIIRFCNGKYHVFY